VSQYLAPSLLFQVDNECSIRRFKVNGKLKNFRSAALLVCVIFGGFVVESAAAQDSQRQQQSDRGQPWSTKFVDETTEGLLIVKLAARPGFNQVKVEVNDGVATLSGKVESKQAEQRAIRVANSTMGIDSVRDDLSVDPSLAKKATSVGEKELAKQVAQRIAESIKGAKAGEDWWFDGWRVEGPFNRWNLVVDVTEPGRIFLEGDVPRIEIMRKAVEAAIEVPGVRTVDSNFDLEPYYAYYGPYAYPYPYYRYYPHMGPPYARHPYDAMPNERAAKGPPDGKEQKR
jgi:hypothetical protein